MIFLVPYIGLSQREGGDNPLGGQPRMCQNIDIYGANVIHNNMNCCMQF